METVAMGEPPDHDFVEGSCAAVIVCEEVVSHISDEVGAGVAISMLDRMRT
jgi:hypothetical protein